MNSVIKVGNNESIIIGQKEIYEQDNFKLLIYLKNFENLLYKENNNIKTYALNYVDFFNMYDKFQKEVVSFIYNYYPNNNVSKKLIDKLFTNKLNALIINNFKNLFYNAMFSNNINNKLYKILKKELEVIVKDVDNLLKYIFITFNNNFSSLFKNKLNINYLDYIENIDATNCVGLDCLLTLKENILGTYANVDVEMDYYFDEKKDNKYIIYLLVIIIIFVLYGLIKIINKLVDNKFLDNAFYYVYN